MIAPTNAAEGKTQELHGSKIPAVQPEPADQGIPAQERKEAEEQEEEITCSACVAAASAVWLVVEEVFRVPTLWGRLVVKAKARWLVTERPWCQRRWILAQLLRCAATTCNPSDEDTTMTTKTMTILNVDNGANGEYTWQWEEVVLPLALVHGGVSSSSRQVSDMRARELFAQLAGWLANAAVRPRLPRGPSELQPEVAAEGDEVLDGGSMLLGFGGGNDDY